MLCRWLDNDYVCLLFLLHKHKPLKGFSSFISAILLVNQISNFTLISIAVLVDEKVFDPEK